MEKEHALSQKEFTGINDQLSYFQLDLNDLKSKNEMILSKLNFLLSSSDDFRH